MPVSPRRGGSAGTCLEQGISLEGLLTAGSAPSAPGSPDLPPPQPDLQGNTPQPTPREGSPADAMPTRQQAASKLMSGFRRLAHILLERPWVRDQLLGELSAAMVERGYAAPQVAAAAAAGAAGPGLSGLSGALEAASEPSSTSRPSSLGHHVSGEDAGSFGDASSQERPVKRRRVDVNSSSGAPKPPQRQGAAQGSAFAQVAPAAAPAPSAASTAHHGLLLLRALSAIHVAEEQQRLRAQNHQLAGLLQLFAAVKQAKQAQQLVPHPAGAPAPWAS